MPEESIFSQIHNLPEDDMEVLCHIMEATNSGAVLEFLGKIRSHENPIPSLPIQAGMQKHNFSPVLISLILRTFGNANYNEMIEALWKEDRDSCVQAMLTSVKRIWSKKSKRGVINKKLNKIAVEEGNRTEI